MDRDITEPGAITAALVVAQRVESYSERWPRTSITNLPFCNYRYASVARLLLELPTVMNGNDVGVVGDMMAAFKCDALPVTANGSNTTDIRLEFVRANHRRFWSASAQLRLVVRASAFISSDHTGDTVISLLGARSLGGDASSWSSEAEGQNGLALSAKTPAAAMVGREYE